MSRTFQDEDLLIWEAYASAGKFGLSANPRIVFHCLSDRSRRARFVDREGDKADAEQEVEHASSGELTALLERSHELK